MKDDDDDDKKKKKDTHISSLTALVYKFVDGEFKGSNEYPRIPCPTDSSAARDIHCDISRIASFPSFSSSLSFSPFGPP